MRCIHDHNRMKLEPHAGAWLHIADGCKKQGSHHLLIARSLPNSLSHFFQKIGLRSFLDQANQRFDSRVELDEPRTHSRVLGRYSGQFGQECQIPDTQCASTHSCIFQKLSARGFISHGFLQSFKNFCLS